MAHIVNLPTFKDNRGSLTVVEKILPFKIKRFYYIYGANLKRGGHRHKKTIQALISLGGECEIYTHTKGVEKTFLLDTPDKCLILNPEDWHTMDRFSQGAILLVLASEYYDKDDYMDAKC